VITHVVAAGETLSAIASAYGVTVTTVAQSSGVVNPNRIYPGQTLVFPSVDGVLHQVRSGESLSLIVRLYRVDPEPVIAANKIIDPNSLAAGTTLIIPGAVIKSTTSAASMAAVSSTSGSAVSSVQFIWPLRGTISSYYGPRWGSFHTGIDIAGSAGATIRAAAAGRVTYSGWYGRYGRTVIIDHGGGFSTLYSHASTLLVDKGQDVSQGQAIATVGSSGNSTGPHLHFEVRVNGQARNPLNYLKD
jgi:murein DD-endopeptidase MepM/ murein hydrolase activator NlpD